MQKLVPILLALLGLLAGTGTGYVLRPPAGADDAPGGGAAGDHAPAEGEGQAGDEGSHAEPVDDHGSDPGDGEGGEGGPEYVKLPSQFVIPVVEDGRVASLVVLSLSLEVAPGSAEAVFSREPKLRDAFLQVLFDHANAGGFRGSFTDGANLIVLRRSLQETARKVMGEAITDVLIADIARQDS